MHSVCETVESIQVGSKGQLTGLQVKEGADKCCSGLGTWEEVWVDAIQEVCHY